MGAEYYLAQEGFQLPTEKQLKDGASYEEAVNGVKGKVDVAFTPYLTAQGVFEIFNETSQALGYPFNMDITFLSKPLSQFVYAGFSQHHHSRSTSLQKCHPASTLCRETRHGEIQRCRLGSGTHIRVTRKL
jgi:hypothetical protein